MPFAEIGDLQLYYERAGEGPPLLLMSGTGGDLRQKPSVFSGALPTHFDLLAYDQRGLGRSDKPEVDYTMADYANDAMGLLDEAGWSRCHVIGISFGGMVAQELVLRYPERVQRLVLACASSGGRGGASYPLHTLAELSESARAIRWMEIGDVRLDANWQKENPDAMARILAGMAKRQHPDSARPEWLEGAARQLAARREHDTWSRLGEIGCPTLVCGGLHDGIAPPTNLIALAEGIRESELAWFEGGHLFLLQDRNAWPRIIDFLLTHDDES